MGGMKPEGSWIKKAKKIAKAGAKPGWLVTKGGKEYVDMAKGKPKPKPKPRPGY